nr:hypothetical protein [Tanacetum cinerariifolium]
MSTTRIETTDEGTKILETVDGKPRTISESSVRRNLKLNDEAGISSLPDAELFENLALMGPSFSGRTVPLFDSMLVHQDDGSETPTEPHHTPSLEAQQSSPIALSSPSLPPATTKTIPTVIPTDIPTLRQYSRRDRIAQSSALSTAADEPASPFGDDSQGEAFPTVSGLEAEQYRENIIKTFSLPHDSPPRVTSLAADKGTQDLEITILKARIKLLEDKNRGDEPASPMRDVSQGETCPTDYGFVADQDRANIAKTSTLPHESTSRLTSLAVDEGSLQLHFQELTDFCTSLQRQQSELVSKFAAQALEITELNARVKFLEDRQGEGQWCVFELGEGGSGKGESWVSGGGGWKVGRCLASSISGVL